MANGASGAIDRFYDYKYINQYNAQFSPSTVHTRNTALSDFFQRYLTQKIFSVFEFENFPEEWSLNYFQYVLFLRGFISIFNTDKFGVIPQHCTLTGRDVFYQPTHCIITNPLIRSVQNPRIGTDCALVKMQPDYSGAWDLVAFYADVLALCAEGAAVNLVNTKLAYVFTAENKAGAESLKKLYDEIQMGNPAVFADKKLMNEDGTPAWEAWAQNLTQNYIAGSILEDMAKWDARFNTEIGIPNVNIAKTSGVGDAEVMANNIDTKSKCEVWRESIERGLEQANNMFGLDLRVKLRWENDNVVKEGKKDERNI